jgi:hypothetical protein
MPNMALPVRALPPQPQAFAPQPTQWQAPPSPAYLASGLNPRPLPAKARGVSADPPAKFVLPSPEALGVTVNLNPRPSAAPNTPVDWNQIQARMERLGVLRYEKDRQQVGGVRVTMLLPTSDPTRGQPVEAQAETEAVAIVMALDAAEAWMQKR